jgi:hypothetical protein
MVRRFEEREERNTMVELEEAPALAADHEERRKRELALLGVRFPEKWGQIRRIHYLWGSYYRVNYHLTEKQNFVGESHFVQVRGDQIVEMN